MAEFDSCYIFAPERVHNRASKKRKLDVSPEYSINPTARLLNGHETPEAQARRLETFERLWREHETVLNAALRDTALSTVASIAAFIDEKSRRRAKGLIPAGILVTRSGTGVPSTLLRSAIDRTSFSLKTLDVEVSASEHLNVKSVIRSINEKALLHAGTRDESLPGDTPSTIRAVSYDLHTLHQCVIRHQIEHVMVLVQDVESMDPKMIADFVELIHAWRSRIPFFLFFGIQTSLSLFECKMSERTMQVLDGRSFEIEDVKFEDLFKIFSAPETSQTFKVSKADSKSPKFRLWIGPHLARRVAARHSEHVLPASSFINTIKTLFMCHFFANALSITLDNEYLYDHMNTQQISAIRCLPSFQSYCQAKIEDGASAEVKKLLIEDDYLAQVFSQNLISCSELLRSTHSLIDLIYSLSSKLLDRIPSYVELYAAGMSGQLASSHFAMDVTSALRRASLNTVALVVDDMVMIPELRTRITPLKQELQALRPKHLQSQQLDLRSSHNLNRHSVRTTIVASKVELSQQTADLTKEEKVYTGILDRLHTSFVDFLEEESKNPLTSFPIEVMMYDFPIPIQTLAGPSIRQAVERGLQQCHDYLGRDHCEHSDGAFGASQPPTLAMYSLYLECGDTINIADLWAAFESTMSPDVKNEKLSEDESHVAPFETGLAELKYLGMIRANRKRSEYLTKTTWKDL